MQIAPRLYGMLPVETVIHLKECGIKNLPKDIKGEKNGVYRGVSKSKCE